MLKLKWLVVFCLLVVAVLAPAIATAEADVPILSQKRLSLGAPANYALYQQAGGQALPSFPKSWEFGAVAAYNLVAQPSGKAPLLSATYSLNYDVDNQFWRHRFGLTLVLFKGGD